MYSQSSQATNFAPGAFFQEKMERRRHEEDLAAQQRYFLVVFIIVSFRDYQKKLLFSARLLYPLPLCL